MCVTVYPAKRRNRHSVAGPQFMGGRAGPVERAPVRRSNTMPPNLGNAGILGKASIEERVTGLSVSIVPFRILFYSNLLFPIQFCSTPIFSTILLHCILLYLILFYYILLGFTFGKVILSIMIIYFGMFFSILFCSFLLYCTLIYSDLFCFVFYFILLSSALFYSIVLGSAYFYWFVLFFWILLLSSYMLTSVLVYSFPINFYSDFILFYSVSL